MIRHAMIVAALALLSGCTSVEDPMLTASIAMPGPASSSEVAPQFALASLTGFGGKVLTIRQTLGAQTALQEIVQANQTAEAGENMLTVDIGPRAERRFQQAPSRADIVAEMGKALPGVAMALSSSPQDNAYGVYGYATGRPAEGGGCVYAWQLVKDVSGPERSGTKAYAARIRLRLCQPDASPEALAAAMNGLRIKPFSAETLSMLRYATPAAPAGPVTATAALAQAATPVATTPRRKTTVVAAAPAATVPATTITGAPLIANAVAVPMPDAVAED